MNPFSFKLTVPLSTPQTAPVVHWVLMPGIYLGGLQAYTDKLGDVSFRLFNGMDLIFPEPQTQGYDNSTPGVPDDRWFYPTSGSPIDLRIVLRNDRYHLVKVEIANANAAAAVFILNLFGEDHPPDTVMLETLRELKEGIHRLPLDLKHVTEADLLTLLEGGKRLGNRE
jgi:hypothetical protein